MSAAWQLVRVECPLGHLEQLLQVLRTAGWEAERVDTGPLTLAQAADLGTHAMDPDRRHTLCGFDLMGERKPDPPEDLDHHRVIECPLCLAVLAAVG